MRYYLMLICLVATLLSVDCYASGDSPNMVIISAEAAIASDDVTDAVLHYSKKNQIMVLKVTFSDKGKQKLVKLFKSNKGRKLALIDGASVIMKPVYLQTETVSDQLDIYIEDENAALNLLKKLSE